MANVNADYKTILDSASNIRPLSSDINTKMNNIYSEFNNLNHTSWQGKSYNDSATLYNKYVESLNEALKFFVSELPTNIEQWGNNLKAADNSESATQAQEDSYAPITAITIADAGTNPIFHNAEVSAYRSNLLTYISDIRNDISNIKDYVSSIQYGDEDDISASNIGKINQYNDTIDEAVGKIKTNIETELAAHETSFNKYTDASNL